MDVSFGIVPDLPRLLFEVRTDVTAVLSELYFAPPNNFSLRTSTVLGDAFGSLNYTWLRTN